MNEQNVGSEITMTKSDGTTETAKVVAVEPVPASEAPAKASTTMEKLAEMVQPLIGPANLPSYGMPGADQKKKMRAKGRRQRQARKLQRRLRKGRT